MPHIHELIDFTVSGLIFHPTEDKLCLHYHKKLNSWLQPGGHIELNEDPLDALIHELQEEAGLKTGSYTVVSVFDVPAVRNAKTLPIPAQINVHSFGDGHQHIDLMYLVQSHTTVLQPEAGESQQIGWFSLAEIEAMHTKGDVMDGTLDIVAWIFAKKNEILRAQQKA